MGKFFHLFFLTLFFAVFSLTPCSLAIAIAIGVVIWSYCMGASRVTVEGEEAPIPLMPTVYAVTLFVAGLVNAIGMLMIAKFGK